MNRVQFIKDYCEESDVSEKQSLFSAFVFCLTPEEACQALDIDFKQKAKKRKTIIRKILKDLEIEVKECHYELISQLLRKYENFNYNKKQICANLLNEISEYFPFKIQQKIDVLFLSSEYSVIRNKVYRRLNDDLLKKHEKIIIENWNKYGDFECAKIFIDNFSNEFLIDNFDNLKEKVKHTSFQLKLYLKTAKNNQTILRQIENEDGITYLYLCTKFHIHPSINVVQKIFDKYKYDRRLMLLIWCIGQLGMWEILESIKLNIDTILENKQKFEIENLNKGILN